MDRHSALSHPGRFPPRHARGCSDLGCIAYCLREVLAVVNGRRHYQQRPLHPPGYRVGRARVGKARARCYFCSCFLRHLLPRRPARGGCAADRADRARHGGSPGRLGEPAAAGRGPGSGGRPYGSRPYGSRRCGVSGAEVGGAWWPRKRCLPPPSRHPGPPHPGGVPSRSESLSQVRGPRRQDPKIMIIERTRLTPGGRVLLNRSRRLTVNSRAVG